MHEKSWRERKTERMERETLRILRGTVSQGKGKGWGEVIHGDIREMGRKGRRKEVVKMRETSV